MATVAETIKAKVEQHDSATVKLRERMDEDYVRYRIEEFTGQDPDFRVYTSNEARSYANKAMSFLSAARMIVRVPMGKAMREKRDANNDKERFLIGVLSAADERLLRLLEQPLQDQLAFYTAVRGWYAVRALLRKSPDGETFIDITPWDPRHTYWGIGAQGLEWACLRSFKTVDEVEAVYGRRIRLDGDRKEMEVFDYYDSENNIVVAEDTVLKRAASHGGKRVPVAIGAVGPSPPVQAQRTKVDETFSDYGESIYKSDRSLYDVHNFVMSVMYELVARAQKQGLVITSRDGNKTLGKNPYIAGTTLSLAEGDKVEPLGLLEMAKETGAFLGLIAGEMQRGSFPHSLFGELQFQLSGFAINSLRQSVFTVVQPSLKAMESAIFQVCNLISDQYAGGSFKPMEVSGQDKNREYFSVEISPERVKQGGVIEVKLVADLPQDEPAKTQIAQFMRQGPVPLLPDRLIREDILQIQDADFVGDAVQAQLASRMSPIAMAYENMVTAAREGRFDIAQIWLGELTKQLLESQLQLGQLQMAATGGLTPGGPPAPGGNGRQPGFAPSVSPPAAQGVPPPTPTPQAGPMVPEGMPRPGAQMNPEVERLLAMGLVPP